MRTAIVRRVFATERGRCACRQGVPVGTDAAAQWGRAQDKPTAKGGTRNMAKKAAKGGKKKGGKKR
jgi:hypothetical protein